MAAGTDIFISYKREERALAEVYASAFSERGFLVVTDLNIPAGTQFDDAIDTMIREATLVVALWTPAAAGSAPVHSEAIEAHKQGKYLGVLAKPTDAKSLPLSLRHSHFIDVSGDADDDAIATVADAVTAHIQQKRAEAKEKSTQDRELAEDMAFFTHINAVGELLGYREYLNRYPTGVYRDQALARIADITEEQERAKDRAAFAEVDRIGALEGYRDYLERHPTGIFRAEAQSRIDRITHWSNRVRRYLGSPTALIQTTFAVLGVVITAYVAFGPAPVTEDGKELISQLRQEKADLQDQFYGLQNTNAFLVQDKRAG